MNSMFKIFHSTFRRPAAARGGLPALPWGLGAPASHSIFDIRCSIFNIFLVLVLCVMTAGCGLFWDDPYVTVTATPLNWVEIHYFNASREPVRRTTVRMDGSGIVEVKTGTSRRVSDSFARNMDDSTWEDIRTRRFTVDPNHVVELCQDLVNHGLFDKDKMFRATKKPSPGRFLAVRAALDNKTYSDPANQFEDDPELAERLLNIVFEFNSVIGDGS